MIFLGMTLIMYIDNLSVFLNKSLSELPYLVPIVEDRPYQKQKTGMVPPLYSFQIEGVLCNDIASFLDSENIAIRAGHHCAQPLHASLGVDSTIRVSLGLYSSFSDVERLLLGLDTAHQLMTQQLE